MQDLALRGDRLIGREDHRSVPTMTVVDDVKQHIRRVGPVGEIAHFIDDQHRGVGVRLQRRCELTRAEGRGEIIDHRGRRDEDGIEAILDGAMRNRDGEVRFPRPGFPVRISDRPSVTKSGESAEPRTFSRTVD